MISPTNWRLTWATVCVLLLQVPRIATALVHKRTMAAVRFITITEGRELQFAVAQAWRKRKRAVQVPCSGRHHPQR